MSLIREERRYGAVRASLYLQRHYHAYVSPTTILKIFHRHHVGPVSQKKHRPGPKPPDAPLQVPGRSVQLDVKFVPRAGRARQRFYQFTAIDEATRFRVLRIYDHDNTKTAIDFLREVQEHFPFATQKIQTDNGSSFGQQFTWHLSDLRISHKHIPPGCPEVNGKVERSHKTDSQEFYQGRHFKHKKDLARKLKRWETEYNEDRPHLALKGKTPAERVRGREANYRFLPIEADDQIRICINSQIAGVKDQGELISLFKWVLQQERAHEFHESILQAVFKFESIPPLSDTARLTELIEPPPVEETIHVTSSDWWLH